MENDKTVECYCCRKEYKEIEITKILATTSGKRADKTVAEKRFVCNKCNRLKADLKIPSNNTSGYIGICKDNNKTCKQGYRWNFRATVDGKQKRIKSSIDYDKLVAFADKWKIDNNYHT